MKEVKVISNETDLVNKLGKLLINALYTMVVVLVVTSLLLLTSCGASNTVKGSGYQNSALAKTVSYKFVLVDKVMQTLKLNSVKFSLVLLSVLLYSCVIQDPVSEFELNKCTLDRSDEPESSDCPRQLGMDMENN